MTLEDEFVVEVDYDAPLAALIAAGRFEAVRGYGLSAEEFFTEERFPALLKGKKRYSLKLYRPGIDETVMRVRRKFAQTEFRHTDLRTLLAFAEKHLQDQYLVTELGQYTRFGGYNYAARISGWSLDGRGRSLQGTQVLGRQAFGAQLVLLAKLEE